MIIPTKTPPETPINRPESTLIRVSVIFLVIIPPLNNLISSSNTVLNGGNISTAENRPKRAANSHNAKKSITGATLHIMPLRPVVI
jgi:hypothetical protein